MVHLMGRKKLEFSRQQLNIRIDGRLMDYLDKHCLNRNIQKTNFVEKAIEEKLMRED